MLAVPYQLEELKQDWTSPEYGIRRAGPELTRLLAWLVRTHPEEEELLDRVAAALAGGCGSLAAPAGGLTRHAGGRLLLQETCYGEGESLGFQTVGVVLGMGGWGMAETDGPRTCAPALARPPHTQWSSATCFTTHFPAERIRALLCGRGRPGKASKALELGCGTGLAGLYCASLDGVVDHVTLSDFCPTVERLARGNIARNQLQERASFVRLDWRWVLEEHPLPWPRGTFDLLLACDVAYELEGGGRMG